jgi:hypothetical protein
MLHGSLETGEITLEFVSQGRECVASIREDAKPQVLQFPNMAFRHTRINSVKCPMLLGTTPLNGQASETSPSYYK